MPMHLSVEDLRPWDWSWPGIAVSPGVTHSDSRIVFVTGTVVKSPTTTTLDANHWKKMDVKMMMLIWTQSTPKVPEWS